MKHKMFASISIALLLGQAGMAAPMEENPPEKPYEIVRVHASPTSSSWELRAVEESEAWFVDYNDVQTYEQGRERLERAPGFETEGLGRDEASPEGYESEPGRNR